MKILIPILTFGRQGGYRVLSELSNVWINEGHECAFLVPETSPEPYFPTKAAIIFANRYGLTESRTQSRKISGFDNVLSLFAGLKKIAKEYDVILANHSITAWPVFLTNCGVAQKYYYIQAYEPDYYSLRKDPFKHILARFSYILPLKQVANSSVYKCLGFNPIEIIPPGINLSIFYKKQSDAFLANKSEIIIGTIGRSEPYKGTATAIAAYRKLRTINSKLKLRVAFGNVEQAEDIEIVDIRNDMELASFYRSIDVLLVTCRGQHGAPHYPVIEAMASGTPVVHTNYYPGDEKNSWPVERSSVESVSDALQKFLSSSPEIIREKIINARKLIEQEFDWQIIGRRFLSMFYNNGNFHNT